MALIYIHNPERLTKPLIRREGVAKTAELVAREDVDKYFREATWEEALDFAANGLKKIRDEKGPNALAGLVQQKGLTKKPIYSKNLCVLHRYKQR